LRGSLPEKFEVQKETEMEVKGYCLKEKKEREMKDVVEVTMKNGRKALKGKCSVCGCGMYKILGKEGAPKKP
jgi:hypothetical protein